MSSNSNNASEEEWSISVKTVGAEQIQGNGDNEMIPSSFQVRVRPSDDIATLHEGIETVTGLKHNQQRLIYRGRIIQAARNRHNNNKENNNDNDSGHQPAANSSSKISEIKGLSDGQTIHLVKRQASSSSDSEALAGSESGSSNNNNNETGGSNDTAAATAPSPGSASGTSLLAALLGLGSLEDDSDEAAAAGDTNNAATAARSSPTYRRYGGGGSRRSRNHFRLTAEDLQVPDAGSMETVRQGLLTLHTLLPNAQAVVNSTTNNASTTADDDDDRPPNPLEQNRRWYIGQWIDCRDTVNQWLEATIIDIVTPEEILPETVQQHLATTTTTPRVFVPAVDAAVGSTDFEGRQRLLLEPCPEGDEDDLGGELEGYRLRDNSHNNVVLLHIHYNGWPHRWDEWIRSDSERIRPFRVRTRHAVAQSSSISPNIQSSYADSPPTYIGGRNDTEDRAFLLQELVRVSSEVNVLAQRAAAALSNTTATTNANETTTNRENLPWSAVTNTATTASSEENGVAIQEQSEVADSDVAPLLDTNNIETSESSDNGRELVGAATLEGVGVATAAATTTTTTTREAAAVTNYDLERLAPLMDRLGRVMVDAAPHIASLAASNPLPRTTRYPESIPAEQDASSHSAADAPGSSANNNNSNNTGNPNSLGGLLSLLNRERRRNSTTSGSQITDEAMTSETGAIDPDYMDFLTGVVNTSRGDVRSGPRGRSGRDDLSGLLGAYLAAASLGGLGSGGGSSGDAAPGSGGGDDTGNDNMQGLGRLLQTRGTGDNNGGIDIHIHAVVTAPGMGPGMIAGGGGGTGPTALALGLGGGGGPASPATTTSDLFANTRRASAQRVRATLLEQNEEDSGIFDDLYSENPDPLASSAPGEETEIGNHAGSGSNHEGSSRRSMRGSSVNPDSAYPSSSNSNNRRSGRRSRSASANNRNPSLFGRLFRRSDRAPES